MLTADRRSGDLAASFERRGATVLRAPTLRIVPLADDEMLLQATRDVIADPPDDVVVTTAVGFRGWVEAADAAGLAPQLLSALGRANLLARGPKARGAIRAAGLTESWVALGETTAEAVDQLLEVGVSGRRVAVQLHGATDDELLHHLEVAGARLHRVPVYRWGPSPDPAGVARAVEAACASAVDAVVFTSAPGAAAFLDTAREMGVLADLVQAFDGDVLAAAVGVVTAGPLRAAGITPLVPDRARLGALVRSVAEALSARTSTGVPTVAGALQLRGQSVLLDDRVVPVPPSGMAILRALVRARYGVVGRAELLAALPSAQDEHAVEVAVGRLRTALGAPGVVQTVVKRGYRLAPPRDPDADDDPGARPSAGPAAVSATRD